MHGCLFSCGRLGLNRRSFTSATAHEVNRMSVTTTDSASTITTSFSCRVRCSLNQPCLGTVSSDEEVIIHKQTSLKELHRRTSNGGRDVELSHAKQLSTQAPLVVKYFG